MATIINRQSVSERAKQRKEEAIASITSTHANTKPVSQRNKELNPLGSGSKISLESSSDRAREQISDAIGSQGSFTKVRKAIQKGTGVAFRGVDRAFSNQVVSDISTGVLQKALWKSLLVINRATSDQKKDTYNQSATRGITLPGSSVTGRLGAGTALPPTDPNKDSKDGPVRSFPDGRGGIDYQKSSHIVGVNESLHKLHFDQVALNRTLALSEGEKLTEGLGKAETVVVYKKKWTRRVDNNKGTFISRVNENSNVRNQNRILIINTCVEKPESNAGHIYLQNRPGEIEMVPKSDWAQIKSMGRNVPMYMYTGAERALHINTSWYIPGKPGEPGFDPYFVLRMCRTLEAWSMANGYLSAPPILMIDWGESPFDNEHITNMFAGNLWILYSATYKLRDFHSTSGKWEKSSFNLKDNPNINFENYGLLPFAATQELIFHQVSSTNLMYPEIINLPGMTVKS